MNGCFNYNSEIMDKYHFRYVTWKINLFVCVVRPFKPLFLKQIFLILTS